VGAGEPLTPATKWAVTLIPAAIISW
jgi:hypothetical protein